MNKVSPYNQHALIGLFVWAIICFVQAYFTELHPDEAYYWVYAQNIEWGHFHQPPMVAAFIKAGYVIFKSELGVRLLFVLAHLASLVMLYKLIQPKNLVLFVLGLGSLFLLHASSLLAVPDTVLIFFTVSFFYVFKSYSNFPSIKRALLLGFLAGGILLSKYHGGLVLAIALFSNLKYFKRPTFYLVVLVALLCFVPHLNWQLEHDWVTFRYHLFGRGVGQYSYAFIPEYLLVQLMLLGPFGGLLLYQTIRSKPDNDFQRTIKTIGLAVFAFFFMLSFTNKIEANWTATAYLCLLITGYHSVESKFSARWLYLSCAGFLVLFMTVRVEIMTGSLFPQLNKQQKYRYYKGWTKALQAEARGRPVVFTNSYQDPSIYMFYTGEQSTSFNSCISPGNQFDFYDFSAQLSNKTVLEIQGWRSECGSHSIQYYGRDICYRLVDDYRDLSAIWIDLHAPESCTINDTIIVTVEMKHKIKPKPVDLSPRGSIRPELMLSWIDDDNHVVLSRTKHFVTESSFKAPMSFKIKAPNSSKHYRLVAGIAFINHFPSRNSYICNIEVAE